MPCARTDINKLSYEGHYGKTSYQFVRNFSSLTSCALCTCQLTPTRFSSETPTQTRTRTTTARRTNVEPCLKVNSREQYPKRNESRYGSLGSPSLQPLSPASQPMSRKSFGSAAPLYSISPALSDLLPSLSHSRCPRHPLSASTPPLPPFEPSLFRPHLPLSASPPSLAPLSRSPSAFSLTILPLSNPH